MCLWVGGRLEWVWWVSRGWMGCVGGWVWAGRRGVGENGCGTGAGWVGGVEWEGGICA